MSASLDDEQLKDGIRMVNIKQTMIWKTSFLAKVWCCLSPDI
jgi:hypothetical protein